MIPDVLASSNMKAAGDAAVESEPVNGAVSLDDMTSKDYYFDSYAHFGIHEVILIFLKLDFMLMLHALNSLQYLNSFCLHIIWEQKSRIWSFIPGGDKYTPWKLKHSMRLRDRFVEVKNWFKVRICMDGSCFQIQVFIQVFTRYLSMLGSIYLFILFKLILAATHITSSSSFLTFILNYL